MKKFQIAVDGTTFHGCEYGDNSLPSLVCLHGMTGDLNSFYGLIEYLKNDFHLILIDNAGHGETESLKLEEDYMFSSLAKSMYQVIQKITNKPFYMLGHSWGADLCLSVAKIFPTQVKGVILLDGGYAFPEHVDGLTEEKALVDWKEYVESSNYGSWDEVVKEYQSYTTKQWDTNLDSLIASSFKKVNDNYVFKSDVFSIQAIIKAFYKEPCSTTFDSIQCPVLLLHATIEATDSARKNGVQEIKKGIQVVKVVGIENTQHHLHWDDPEKVANEILLWKQESNHEVY
ncbi:alpha/beta hydrolase [Sporosarcina sp. BI001-red]|uniref:alpha/beta fold hydrolase n=1 Tax=Sporosarcina sp. BI001-red TaxID=2282866 RepID=UPI000E22B070|nr:alpha/beta hydrolase [Sporosarcina sp. BI001-red]REB05486.1 alpha/beta hydrolase [Sporosarcina sp. BI001-red]